MSINNRLDLQKLIKEYDAEETTDKIRSLKHSSKIKEGVQVMLNMKKKYSRLAKTNNEQFTMMVRSQCRFLYDNYTNIFNRLIKDELSLEILSDFLRVLKRIEDGEIDQHEGSIEIGTLLKRIYIDSAIRQSNKQKKKDAKREKKMKKKRMNTIVKNISWSEYKMMQDN